LLLDGEDRLAIFPHQVAVLASQIQRGQQPGLFVFQAFAVALDVVGAGQCGGAPGAFGGLAGAGHQPVLLSGVVVVTALARRSLGDAIFSMA
jgi:hypothetical protein